MLFHRDICFFCSISVNKNKQNKNRVFGSDDIFKYQKGAITIQRYSAENQKGAIAIDIIQQ